jgi:L-glyceraldehyde 3-phosphate reductase
VGALEHPDFSEDELQEIDYYAQEGNINIWAQSSNNGAR